MELSQLCSFADGAPIERLRRSQLWQIAAANGIPYPPDATKETMISLLKGSNIDVTKPIDGLRWEQVTGRDERGNQSSYLHPVPEPHRTAREGIDSSAVLQDRIAIAEERATDAESKNTAQADVIKQQREQIEALSDLVRNLQSSVEQMNAAPKPKPKRRGNPNGGSHLKRYHALKAEAKAFGLDVPTGTKLPELEAMVREAGGQNTTSDSQ